MIGLLKSSSDILGALERKLVSDTGYLQWDDFATAEHWQKPIYGSTVIKDVIEFSSGLLKKSSLLWCDCAPKVSKLFRSFGTVNDFNHFLDALLKKEKKIISFHRKRYAYFLLWDGWISGWTRLTWIPDFRSCWKSLCWAFYWEMDVSVSNCDFYMGIIVMIIMLKHIIIFSNYSFWNLVNFPLLVLLFLSFLLHHSQLHPCHSS